MRLERAMPSIADRSKTLCDVAEMARFFLQAPPIEIEDKARKALDEDGLAVLRDMQAVLSAVEAWDEDSIKAALMAYAETKELKLGKEQLDKVIMVILD